MPTPIVAFTVLGVPKSVQAKNRRSVQVWKDRVADAARAVLLSGFVPLDAEVRVAVTYFYSHATDLDVDNIAKPIVDAMAGVVYEDDRLVTEVVLRKTDQTGDVTLLNPPPELADALYSEPHFVYVRCYGPPDHEELL